MAKAKIAPGTYRKITGNEADRARAGRRRSTGQASRSFMPATRSRRPVDILHELAEMQRFGVNTFQAEDEIAAIGVAIGASFGGAIGVTGTSGPGICLKSEAIGLAVMTELPLVDRRRAARRAEHRPADQDRAGRPAAGDVRPQRRMPRRPSSPRSRPPIASTWPSRRFASPSAS